MQSALHIGPAAWCWVNAVFAIAFACFEIPMGELGDRIGPRKVLTRIVLWWLGFTALTGAMVRLPVLLDRKLYLALPADGSPFVPRSVAMDLHRPPQADPILVDGDRRKVPHESENSLTADAGVRFVCPVSAIAQ